MHSFTWWPIALSLIIWSTGSVLDAAKQSYELRIKNVSMTYDANCGLASVLHNRTHLTLLMDVQKTLDAPLMIQLVIDINIRDSMSYRFATTTDRKALKQVVNTKIEYCDFLRHPNSDPVLYLLYGPMINDTERHFLPDCPVETVMMMIFGGRELCVMYLYALTQGHYFLKNYSLDMDMLPMYLPNLDFIANFSFYKDIVHNNGTASERVMMFIRAEGQLGSRKRMRRRNRKSK